jgi:hypothetical protein
MLQGTGRPHAVRAGCILVGIPPIPRPVRDDPVIGDN